MDKIGHNHNVGSQKLGFCSHTTFCFSPVCSRLYYLLFQNSMNQYFPSLSFRRNGRKEKEMQPSHPNIPFPLMFHPMATCIISYFMLKSSLFFFI